MTEDSIAQGEEIDSLRSIYLEEELTATQQEDGRWKLVALVPVEVPHGYKMRYYSNLDNNTISTVNIKHLPPLQVTIHLPEDYPSKSGPKLTLRCKWISKGQSFRVLRSIRQLWKENVGFPIVYTWLEHLKTETLAITGMEEEMNLTLRQKPKTGAESSPVKRHGIDPLACKDLIETYNIDQEKKAFGKNYHMCEICLTEKKGVDSILFQPCLHTFCRDCLRNYFTVLVNEGSSCAVKCPAFKCDSEVSQFQMREVLPPELFEKYDRALLSTMLDTIGDIMYCPRTMCQYPVTCVPEDRVAVCPTCNYAFCVFCRMVYHGVEPCKFKSDERKRIVEAYQNADRAERLAMEARYGKKQLDNLVSNTLSEFWIQTNGKNCPRCNVVIEKSDGCNKMTCYKCQAFFCWLCGDLLDGKDPYLHYQDGGRCNNQLFVGGGDGMDGEEGEEDLWWLDYDSGAEDLEGEDTDTDDEYVFG